jgi:hypothetical protein
MVAESVRIFWPVTGMNSKMMIILVCLIMGVQTAEWKGGSKPDCMSRSDYLVPEESTDMQGRCQREHPVTSATRMHDKGQRVVNLSEQQRKWGKKDLSERHPSETRLDGHGSGTGRGTNSDWKKWNEVKTEELPKKIKMWVWNLEDRPPSTDGMNTGARGRVRAGPRPQSANGMKREVYPRLPVEPAEPADL